MCVLLFSVFCLGVRFHLFQLFHGEFWVIYHFTSRGFPEQAEIILHTGDACFAATPVEMFRVFYGPDVEPLVAVFREGVGLCAILLCFSFMQAHAVGQCGDVAGGYMTFPGGFPHEGEIAFLHFWLCMVNDEPEGGVGCRLQMFRQPVFEHLFHKLLIGLVYRIL